MIYEHHLIAKLMFRITVKQDTREA